MNNGNNDYLNYVGTLGYQDYFGYQDSRISGLVDSWITMIDYWRSGLMYIGTHGYHL